MKKRLPNFCKVLLLFIALIIGGNVEAKISIMRAYSIYTSYSDYFQCHAMDNDFKISIAGNINNSNTIIKTYSGGFFIRSMYDFNYSNYGDYNPDVFYYNNP